MATDERLGGVTRTIVVCGPSGVGKSTVGALLARRIGADWAEGDDFHSPENVARMAAGRPLTDADREPWLRAISAWIAECERAGRDAVVACSALKRRYRDTLRDGHASVRFVQLRASERLLEQRTTGRRHRYMPASLLPSQLEILEPLEPDEPGFVIDAVGDSEAVVSEIVERLLRSATVDRDRE